MIWNAFDWMFDMAATFAEFITAAASLVTTAIAWFALRSWQRQDRAKREADFLDALIEATHTFIVDMSGPIMLLRFARIGMLSHVSLFDEREEAVRVAEGAIPYIKAHGARDAKQLMEALSDVRPASIRLRSLSSKGQVFAFQDYAKCQKAIAMLVWQFDCIESFATIVGSPSLNWQNPEVQRTLQNVLKVNEGDIQKHISENDVEIIEYAREAYTRIYPTRRKGVRGIRRASAQATKRVDPHPSV